MRVEPNKTYIGVVEDNVDPKKQGRLKIRVLDVYDDLKVEDIPFASPWKDLNGNEFNVPEKGKVLLVVFDQGDEYKPEFISAEHYNINLERKLNSLDGANYTSMKSLIFDHKTQIYVNDQEGLKIDYKYNNVNIQENSIDLNLKDNNRSLNLGDATAGQQAILGNHWMDWFDKLVDNLMGSNGGPYLGNMGAPVVANPGLIQVLQEYKQLRDPVFLSHHVNIVDNDKITTVKNTQREDTSQLGDSWNSTKTNNNLTSKTNESFKPVDGPKPPYNDKHVEPSQPVSPISATAGVPTVPQIQAPLVTGTASAGFVTPPVIGPVNANPPMEPLSSTKAIPKVDKLISLMKSKGYQIYEEIGVLNMIALQSSKKDNGSVSNKFDDVLNIFYKKENGNWELVEYQLTTTPGYLPKSEILPQNVTILALGQYIDQCKIEKYEDGTKYLSFAKSTVMINESLDCYNYKSAKQDGYFKTITIHASSKTGSAENVYNYSEGAQVFKNITQYNQFISLCELQYQLTKKDTYTYTLCRNTDFENYIPEN